VAITPPAIVVPGITATDLRDYYPLPPELVWGVLERDYDRAALHPDDLRYEARQPARLMPDQIFEVAYEELVEELRYNLKDQEDQPVPVYPFGYDWRQPLERLEGDLAGFVDEVIERTKLLKHYDRAGYADDPRVNLVGHSMGGLIIAGYLERHGRDARVAKVATLATPFRGSFEAVVKIATGTANLAPSVPGSREREAARLTPALYHLLPSFESALEVEPGIPHSLFDPRAWQPSVTATIAEYVRLHGLDARNRRAQARRLFQAMLRQAEAHRGRIEGFRLDRAGLQASDWLCVVGVDAETRVRLKIVKADGAVDFQFRSADRQNQWEELDPGRRRLTGDGTVPFEGAAPTFLGLANLVCVTPEDFGYWELVDQALARAGGFHAILPNMDLLHRLIVRHFTGRPDRHGNTWGRPAPGVMPEQWDPPIADLRNKQK
jgi:pimeloyl-ACP methyl ester carboxylesterase